MMESKLTQLWTAIFVYDWLLTFSAEIRLIWSRKITGAKILFLANRYIFMAFVVSTIVDDHALGVSDDVSNNIWTHCCIQAHFLFAEVCQTYYDYSELDLNDLPI